MSKKLLLSLLISSSAAVFSQEKIEVFFDFDRYTLNEEALGKLNSWVDQKSNIEVSKIYGYCDWKGSNSYNDALSLKRVTTVYDFLTKNKIKIKSDYERKGYGENFTQSKIQSKNRKVTIIYYEKATDQKKTTKNEDSLSLMSLNTLKPGDKIMLKNINFENNSPVILPKSEDDLYQLLHILQKYPKLKIEIQGHICCRLDGDVNDISTARAHAIYTFLIKNKINENRLTYKGYGTSNPIFPIPENSEDEKESNRRVEIMVIEN